MTEQVGEKQVDQQINMARYHIPPKKTRRWTGVYPGDYYGTFRKTFGIDFDRYEGSFALAAKMERIEDSTELTDLSGDSNRITQFVRTDADGNDRYWALSPVALFKTDSSANPNPTRDWDSDPLDSSPTNGLQDFAIHGNDSRNDSGNNKLVVSLDSDIAILNDTGNNAWTGSWWVTKHSQAALDTSVPHPTKYFPFRKITVVGDGNLVHTIHRPSDTQNDTLTYARLILPKQLVITSVITTQDRVWFGCSDIKKERGAVVEWDGFSESYNKLHNVLGTSLMSGVDYAGIPIFLENTGRFLEFTGNGFTPMIRNGQEVSLLNPEDIGSTLVNGQAYNSWDNNAIHRNGMVTGEDGMIYINYIGAYNGGYGAPHDRMGGIWSLNPNTGRLYNKHAFSIGGTDSSDAGQQSGPQFNTSCGGLYWSSNDALLFGRNLLAGGTINTQDSVSEGGIWLSEDYYNGIGPNRGYVVTQFIPANEVEETWDFLWLKLRTLANPRTASAADGNQVIVKARGAKDVILSDVQETTDRAITWLSATTFTLTSASSYRVGDEVEVLYGRNAGLIAHITDITGTTVTIDESATTTSGTSRVRIERWHKLGILDVDKEPNQSTKKFNIGLDSSWIQFKILIYAPEGPYYARMTAVDSMIVSSTNAINVEG